MGENHPRPAFERKVTRRIVTRPVTALHAQNRTCSGGGVPADLGEPRVSTSGWTLHPLVDTRGSPKSAGTPSGGAGTRTRSVSEGLPPARRRLAHASGSCGRFSLFFDAPSAAAVHGSESPTEMT